MIKLKKIWTKIKLKSWINPKFKFLAELFGFLAVFGTVILHGISIFPLAWGVMFPNPQIEIVEYDSNSRLVIANTGNHELFISYIYYEGCKNLEKGAACMNNNEDIGVSIKPGEIINRSFGMDSVKNFQPVYGQKPDEWNQTVATAICHSSSTCITPLFFHPDARIYKQFQRITQITGANLNTFPLEITIHAYSPRLKKEIIFSFEVLGVVIKSNEIECKEILDKWLASPEC